jgi:hypothetical protein
MRELVLTALGDIKAQLDDAESLDRPRLHRARPAPTDGRHLA